MTPEFVMAVACLPVAVCVTILMMCAAYTAWRSRDYGWACWFACVSWLLIVLTGYAVWS